MVQLVFDPSHSHGDVNSNPLKIHGGNGTWTDMKRTKSLENRLQTIEYPRNTPTSMRNN